MINTGQEISEAVLFVCFLLQVEVLNLYLFLLVVHLAT